MVRLSVGVGASLLLVCRVDAQLHFASLGSWGRSNNDQKAVAQTLKSNAQSPPLSFIVSPGSNFMEGVSDLEDSKWRTQFEDIYEGSQLNLPFFAALGANDWDGNVTAMVLKTNITYGKPLSAGTLDEDLTEDPMPSNEIIDSDRDRPLLPRHRKGPRWTLPNFYYHYTQSFPDTSASTSLMAAPEVSAFFIFIDTKILGQAFPVDPITTKHWNDLRSMVESASKTYDWVIAVGDQAIFSSGSGGGSAYLRNNLRPLFRDNLIDAYISGNDYNMEVIEDGSLTHITCGSASGGSVGRVRSHDGSVFFSSKTGYCLHTLDRTKMRTTFIDGYSGKPIDVYDKLRNHRSKRFQDRLFHLHRIPSVAYLPLPPGVGGAPGGVLPTGRHPNTIFVLVCGTVGLLSTLIISGTALATSFRRFNKYRSRRD